MISIRYKEPHEDVSRLIEAKTYVSSYTETPSQTFRFASSVVEFGLILRDSRFKGDANFDQVISRATQALGQDTYGYREEFLELVEIAKEISFRD